MGVDRVRVALTGEIVIVAGERRLPIEARAAILRLEIPHGSFERRIRLPAGRYELSHHDLADGCLILGLRKLN